MVEIPETVTVMTVKGDISRELKVVEVVVGVIEVEGALGVEVEGGVEVTVMTDI